MMVTWTKVVTVVVIKSGQILEIKTTEFAKRLCPMRGREVLRILLVTFPLHYIKLSLEKCIYSELFL